MSDLKLTLYSTWGCHLCEEAQSMLFQLQVPFTLLDIVDDAEAFAQFRTQIPVLGVGSHFLYWPFDQAAIHAFINEHCVQGN